MKSEGREKKRNEEKRTEENRREQKSREKRIEKKLKEKRKQQRLSAAQVRAMEQEFDRHPYVLVETRAMLTSTLSLTEMQVKTYFTTSEPE